MAKIFDIANSTKVWVRFQTGKKPHIITPWYKSLHMHLKKKKKGRKWKETQINRGIKYNNIT